MDVSQRRSLEAFRNRDAAAPTITPPTTTAHGFEPCDAFDVDQDPVGVGLLEVRTEPVCLVCRSLRYLSRERVPWLRSSSLLDRNASAPADSCEPASVDR